MWERMVSRLDKLKAPIGEIAQRKVPKGSTLIAPGTAALCENWGQRDLRQATRLGALSSLFEIPPGMGHVQH